MSDGVKRMATKEQVESLKTREQKYGKRKSGDMYFPKGLVNSPALWELTATAIRVYMVFRSKIVVKPFEGSKSKREKKGKYVFPNIDELQFTYREAKEKYGISSGTFRRAIELLVKIGLIDITHAGNGIQRDVSLYAISGRWEKFGTDEFVVKKRQKRTQHYGFTKRNTCGRNAGKK